MKAFDNLYDKLGYKTMDDWYNVSTQSFNGRKNLLSNYNGSYSTALQHTYPQHKWELHKFKQRPNGYWKNVQHQLEFFDRLYDKLGYTTMDDWYNVTIGDISANGGGRLLRIYNDSPSAVLQNVYPHHHWDVHKFAHKPKQLKQSYSVHMKQFLHTCGLDNTPMGFWTSMDNHCRFMDWLGDKLGYKDMDDWYNVTADDMNVNGGGTLLNQHYNGSPSAVLQSVYPQHIWDLHKFKQMPHRYWHSKQNQLDFMNRYIHLYSHTHTYILSYTNSHMHHILAFTIHVCILTYTCTITIYRIHTLIQTFTYIHHTHIQKLTYIHIRIHADIHIHHTYIHMHTIHYIHTCIHTDIHIHTRIHTYTVHP